MLNSKEFYSALAQCVEFIGVLILFYHGLPFKLPERNLYIEESTTDTQKKKDSRQKRYAYIGLTLLTIGFLLQLLLTLFTKDCQITECHF
jgi:hypothetical protein